MFDLLSYMAQDEHGMFYSMRTKRRKKGNVVVLYILFESEDEDKNILVHQEEHACSYPGGGIQTTIKWRKYLEQSLPAEINKARLYLNKRTEKQWKLRAFVGWQIQNYRMTLNVKRIWSAMREDGGIELKDGGVLYRRKGKIIVINWDGVCETYPDIEAMRKTRKTLEEKNETNNRSRD